MSIESALPALALAVLAAYGAVLCRRLRRIHRWELRAGPHRVLVERHCLSLRPFLRFTMDGKPMMAIDYREVGWTSQFLGGGFKFDFKEFGVTSDVSIWTKVDWLGARLLCWVEIDRGERKPIEPLLLEGGDGGAQDAPPA